VTVENLFDTTYAVGKDPATGILRIGAPRLFHGSTAYPFRYLSNQAMVLAQASFAASCR